ncbi:MAG: nuclear transport factor 2 family protein [Promethearchaeota archaeon]
MENEEKAIKKTLDLFVDGMNTLDYDKISKTFYAEGQSIGAREGKIQHVLRDHWKEMGDKARAEGRDFSNDTAHYEIKSLKIFGNAASVIIDLAFGIGNEINERYVDFYHLLKIGEQWYVVNKIYSTSIRLPKDLNQKIELASIV